MKKFQCIVFSLIISLLITASPAVALAIKLGPLINPQQVKILSILDAMGLDDIVIIDLTTGYDGDDMATHKTGHIPGALFMNWRKDLAQFPYPVLAEGSDGALLVPNINVFEAKLRSLGINKKTRIILYDNLRNRAAIRAMFVLEYFGQSKRIHILEGGLDAYIDACEEDNNCLDTCSGLDCPISAKKGNIVLKSANTDMTINYFGTKDKEGIQDLIAEPKSGVTIIDARPYEMFIGDRIGQCIHTGQAVNHRGHMPGALARPWPDNEIVPGYFKSKRQLKKLYKNINNYGQEELILYCNEGLHAVYDWFVLTKLLKYPKSRVKVYEGSIGEYSRQEYIEGVHGSSPQVSGCDKGVQKGPECRGSELYTPPSLLNPPPSWYTGP